MATLIAAAFVFRSIAKQIYPDHPLASVAAFWGTLLYYPLIFWTLRGMETGRGKAVQVPRYQVTAAAR